MRSRWRSALLVAGLATAAGVYFATQLHLVYPESVRRPWGEALAINLAYYWVWGAMVPLVVRLARRVPLQAGHWWAGLAIHAAAGVVLTVATNALGRILLAATGIFPRALTPSLLLEAVIGNFHSAYPTYWLILFVVLALDYHDRWHDRALRAAQLEQRLAEARLDALRMQLNPHFLFNALNSISALMYEDVEAADTMMRKLGDLLRLSLEEGRGPEITLRAELDLVERYLDIERVRFESRLRVRLDVDPAALEARLPAFALQPLVENAIRHAIAPRPAGGALELHARRENGHLRVSISDDGPGLPSGRLAEGVGLANTRARLQELYGEAGTLTVGQREGGGVCVEMVLPFRPATAP